jgi:hypothetical protein
MTAPASPLSGLFDLAALLAPAGADATAVLRDYRRHRDEASSGLLADLVVPDHRLAEVARGNAGAAAVPVCVLNTTGAGGLVALAGRSLSGLSVVSVQSALRDLDDLAGNAARVVSAASALAESVSVYVEIPRASGWQRAVEEVEAAGLLGAVRVPGGPTAAAELAEQLSVRVEADLPFRVVGAPVGYLGLLHAVQALIDGSSVREATELLGQGDPSAAADAVRSWDAAAWGRVRRRVRRLESPALDAVTDELVAAGLTEPA